MAGSIVKAAPSAAAGTPVSASLTTGVSGIVVVAIANPTAIGASMLGLRLATRVAGVTCREAVGHATRAVVLSCDGVAKACAGRRTSFKGTGKVRGSAGLKKEQP